MRFQNERDLRSLIDQRLQERSGVTSVSDTYGMNEADRYVLADASSAAFTVSLMSAIGQSGREYTVVRTNSGGNAVTVGTIGGQTISGSATVSLSSQYDRVTVVSDNENWLRVD